jgi:hypothetical protein
MKNEDRNWSRTAMPDSYWPSSKQLLTRLRWCVVISRSSLEGTIMMRKTRIATRTRGALCVVHVTAAAL